MNDNVTPIAGHNGVDKKALQGYVDREESVQSEIDEIMEKAREDCQPHRDDIKTIRNEAVDDGFAKKTFGALITRRKHQRKAENADAKLNDDQKESYTQMLHALGDLVDTPLGQAALN